MLTEFLQNTFAAPGAAEVLRAALLRKVKARKGDTGKAEGLRQQLDKLKRMIERGTENLLLADTADVPAANGNCRSGAGNAMP